MLDISEVAHLSGLPASALRYYEEKGLIMSSGRCGLRRLYDEDVLPVLSLISLGQSAGFSLAEIAGMLNAAKDVEIDRDQLKKKAEDIDQKIQELARLRDGLLHVIACTAPNHLECPRFQRIMRVGAARHIARRRPLRKRRMPK